MIKTDYMISIKRTFFFFLLAAMGKYLFAQPYLRIVQPFEEASLPPVESSFVFGSILPATATLTINGVAVKPHKNGGFITMIPFKEGRFKIEAVASDGISVTTVTRTVNVAEFPKALPADSKTILPLSPVTRLVVRPDDVITVSCQGPPGGEGSFRFQSSGHTLPLYEQPGSVAGIYSGGYRIQPNDDFDEDDVTFFIKRRDGKKISKSAKAKITVQRRKTPRYVRTKEETVLLTGPGSEYGYHLFLEDGIQLEVIGEWGEFVRVAIGKDYEGWLKKSTIESLPSGAPPQFSITRNVKIDATDESTTIEFHLKYRHAHRVEQIMDPHRLRLTLYGVIPDTDRIRFKSQKAVVKEMNWVQNGPETVVFEILTTQKQAWGYDVRYQGTTLILEIRHSPALVAPKAKTLNGLKIAIDAGHSKNSFGTIGPWANTEATVNLLVAEKIKSELEKKGAKVVMIQDGTKELSLTDRTQIAWAERAHLFISLHCDATAEGQDPRETAGFSVYYYHPQSHLLAQSLHKLYGEKTKISDQGLLRANLAVCRMTQMPAILLEMGYLVLPESEELLMSDKFHKLASDVVLNSLQSYFDRVLR